MCIIEKCSKCIYIIYIYSELYINKLNIYFTVNVLVCMVCPYHEIRERAGESKTIIFSLFHILHSLSCQFLKYKNNEKSRITSLCRARLNFQICVFEIPLTL